ncbi:MAG: GlcG/HbpS family heme-binding protein [Polaromonas sp.]
MSHTKRTFAITGSILATLSIASSLALSNSVQAQVQTGGKTLTLALATEAAQEAVHSCEASGYRVSVSVVNVAGVERAFLRGDRSTIHTRETAFKKAYTVVTLGPIFASTTTSALTERIGKTPTGPAPSTVNNIILLAGGVAIRAGDETLAAIGVGGAPGGALDEVFAQADVAKVQDRVNALQLPKP